MRLVYKYQKAVKNPVKYIDEEFASIKKCSEYNENLSKHEDSFVMLYKDVHPIIWAKSTEL